jgi:hypothetical protein
MYVCIDLKSQHLPTLSSHLAKVESHDIDWAGGWMYVLYVSIARTTRKVLWIANNHRGY